MNQPMRTEAIKNFLIAKTHKDLAHLYSHNMEVQVNVAQDGGERVESTFQGRQWHGWTDGFQTWKSFRIPYKANSVPEYQDKPMNFDLAAHAEGIGMTGWDWQNRCSRWVAFDFDAIVGHSDRHGKKFSDIDLKTVQQKVSDIPWVTIRYSTSGSGLHLYVFLNNVPTANHNEHAALARSIIGVLSAITSYDLKSKVDICGGNMWVWHRKMQGTCGLELIKQGGILTDLPANWKDHVKVVTGTRNKVLPAFAAESDDVETMFEELSSQRTKIPLDDDHRKLIDYLQSNGFVWWWDADHHMLVTHSFALKKAHQALGLRGIYDTMSQGTELHEQNCFSGETEVITKDGVFTLKELEGTEPELYVKTDSGFEWVRSKVLCFGEQHTFPITFGDGHTVRTTYNHEWLVHKNDKITRKFTYELKEGYSELVFANIELPEIDYEGYAHGFVYGDGWEYSDKKGNLTCQVALFKHDNDLINLLTNYGEFATWKLNDKYTNFVIKLPGNWKTLPKNPTKEYALGFVLGLISADGHVCKRNSSIKIFQSDYAALEKIKKLAIFAGLKCFPIRLYGKGSYENAKDNWSLGINTYNLESRHFIRNDQRDAFSSRVECKAITPSKIDGSNPIKEKVYCAVVPKWHNFTLSNWIVTGNCFCAPLRRGAWSVRRFTPGVQEANTWTTDASGWTQCYFNQAPDLRSAARAFGGVEDTDGAYVFREAEVANQASSLLGATLELPNWLMSGRQTKLKQHKDGRIIVEIKHEPSDITTPEMANWLIKKGTWQRIYNIKNSDVGEPETGNYDDIVRHLVTESGEDAGWVIKNEGSWISEPYVHVKIFLQGLGIVQKETTQILGSCINKCWRLVNRPFQDEYIGDRQWNRSAAQLRYAPSDPTGRLHYPTWLLILNHVGQSLDNIIKQNPWAKMNHVLTGADYLKCWLSSMFKEPTEPLPYLFLYGPQASGKSIFHEAIELLVTSGVVRADAALINQSGFNAEIENGVLCVVEETDMQKNKVAYNRIKDFVTSRKVSIHRKGQTPYSITNTSHWIHCSNELNACPVFPGDSRITMLYVPELKNHIPKKELIPRLEKEAPDFLSVLLNLEIPYSHDRLNIPVIETEDKKSAQEANRTLLEEWLDDHCFYSPGHWVKYADLYAAFKEWTDPNYHFEWSMVRFGKELPKHKFPKGRNPKDAQWYIGNISLEAAEDTGKIYKLEGDKLILTETK